MFEHVALAITLLEGNRFYLNIIDGDGSRSRSSMFLACMVTLCEMPFALKSSHGCVCLYVCVCVEDTLRCNLHTGG